MKSKIYLLFLVIPYFLTAQKYLDATSSWKEFNVNCGAGRPYCDSVDYTINLIGDTTINGIKYFKTLLSGVITTWDWTEDTLVKRVSILQVLDPIRELDGVFYRYTYSLNIERPFHDFNLMIGDTAISNIGKPLIVERIDTVFVGTMPRKRFRFESTNLYYLIEGIGSTRGLFSYPFNGIFIEAAYRLQCYSQNNEFYQIDTTINCGNVLNNIEKIKDEDLFQLFPNPAKDNFSIILNNFNSGKRYEFRIFDQNGKQIFLMEINDWKTNVDLSSFVQGMYFFQIDDKSKRIKIGKFVKL